MESIYSVKMHLTYKNVTILNNVAYTPKTISLTGTSHNLEFFRKFLECFRDTDFFVNEE